MGEEMADAGQTSQRRSNGCPVSDTGILESGNGTFERAHTYPVTSMPTVS